MTNKKDRKIFSKFNVFLYVCFCEKYITFCLKIKGFNTDILKKKNYPIRICHG